MLWVLSGLGGDSRLYDRVALPADAQLVTWDQFAGCQRMADFVDRALELGVKDGDQIIGSSFGGMIGCELSHRRQLRGLLLLGSAIEQREINRLVLLAGGFARAMDGRLLQRLATPLRHVGPKQLAVAMFCDQCPRLMADMYAAILAWGGCQPACPTIRVHGRLDPVIPWRSHRHYDQVTWCSHLVALESPAATNRAINKLRALA